MRSPFIIFNLLQIHLVDDFWFEVCSFEFEYYSGSLFAVRRFYEGIWDFDFLYIRMFLRMYMAWIERRRQG